MNNLGINLGILLESEGYPSVGPSNQLVSLVADALNGEAARWMSDFLLIGNDLYEKDENALMIIFLVSK
ncbi:hypothetical protein M408DRAFT_327528 [Serendipita vermifera MAFF 305830]|uniref:Uncharacterized protein n=1 Tax=Serendipita vermifera MAFF 305830 TaxID=933852 RepID=A0A0C2WYV1_SERVB|nr:hypothetical protein M408DRAFT_327528 [Serendipita vermifera MAFF 305830]